jgi:TolB-like protein
VSCGFILLYKESKVMKKAFLSLIFVFTAVFVFAQQLPTVAVATFDTMGGITQSEAQIVTELFMTELVSKGTVNVVDRNNFDVIIAEMRFQTSDWSDSQKTARLGRALNAHYVIRGQLMKMGNVIYWTATMIDVNTAQVLYSAREQMNDLGEIFGKLSGFCSQMISRIPIPNPFIGKWRAEVPYTGTNVAGTLICIMEFKADGSIIVERFDAVNTQIQTGYGTGSYTFNEGEINITLTLRGIAFDSRTSRGRYTISSNSLVLPSIGCVYTGYSRYYSSFIKIQ